MALVRIYAFARPDPLHGLRAAVWAGDPGWPGAPRPGDTWFHCADWGGELIDRTAFNAPVPADGAALDVEVRTGVDVLAHLVDAHGFVGTWAQPVGS